MNGLILYIIKSALYTSVFQSFYMLVMRKTTFLRLNRVIFITGTLICLLLPFINIEMPEESELTTPIAFIEEALVSEPQTIQAAIIGAEAHMNWTSLIISTLFITGAFISFLVTAISYIRMSRVIRSVKPENIDGAEVRNTMAEA